MAISFVGSKTQTAAGAVGSLSFLLTDLLDTGGGTATLLQDDFVVIVVACGSNTDRSYTPPVGWTEETELYSNNTTDCNFYVLSKKMGAVPDSSVSIPHSGSTTDALAGAAIAFRGVDTTTALDVASVTATGTGTGRPNAAAITPSTAGSWIVVGGGAGYGVTGAVFTASDLSSTTNHFKSATQADNFNTIVGIGIKTDWASGAFDPASWGGGATNAGDSWAALTLAIRPASSSTYTLTASSVSFTLSGTAAAFALTRKLTAAAASYALSGTAATPKAGRLLTSASASYTLSATATGLLATRKLTAASTSYSLSGTAASLKASRLLNAASANYALTGSGATLIYVPPSGAYTLTGDSGAFVLSGSVVTFGVTSGPAIWSNVNPGGAWPDADDRVHAFDGRVFDLSVFDAELLAVWTPISPVHEDWV